MPNRPPQPSPYDDPFSPLNLLQYGPDEPISAVRPKPVFPPGTIFVGKEPDSVAPDAAAEPPAANAPGRPRTFDAEKQETYCVLVRAGCSRAGAARLLNLSRQTILNSIHADPEFAERVSQAERQCEALALTNIARAGGKSWRASAWLVDRRGRSRRRARAPSVAAVLKNRQFRRELKSLIREELAPQPATETTTPPPEKDPYARPDLDQLLRACRGSPAAIAARASELAAVRSKLLSQIHTICARRAEDDGQADQDGANLNAHLAPNNSAIAKTPK